RARPTGLRAGLDAAEVAAAEQDRFWLTESLRAHERGGITREAGDQARLRELNAELAGLTTQFDQILVEGRNAAAVHVVDEERLRGLSDDEKAGLREAAQARSLEGWLVPIVNTTGQPLLSLMEDRGLR